MRAAPAIRPSSYMLAPAYLKTVPASSLSITEVFEIVSAETGVSIENIKSKCRFREYTFARQVICYICTQLANPSYTNGIVGRELNMDHSSVIYGTKQIRHFLQFNCKEKTEIEKILQKFKREN